MLVFSETSKAPFLADKYGLVKGKWDPSSRFEFSSESFEDPDSSAVREGVFDSYRFSLDTTEDGHFLATTIAFSTCTRVAIWNRIDGKLVLSRNYPRDEKELSPLTPVCCRAIGDRTFCFNLELNLYHHRFDSETTQAISTKKASERYNGVVVLGLQKNEEIVTATCALTPIDSESIRKIEIKLD